MALPVEQELNLRKNLPMFQQNCQLDIKPAWIILLPVKIISNRATFHESWNLTNHWSFVYIRLCQLHDQCLLGVGVLGPKEYWTWETYTSKNWGSWHPLIDLSLIALTKPCQTPWLRLTLREPIPTYSWSWQPYLIWRHVFSCFSLQCLRRKYLMSPESLHTSRLSCIG